MDKLKLRLTLYAYGFHNSASLLSNDGKEFVLTLPKGFYCNYWKLDEGNIVVTGTSLN